MKNCWCKGGNVYHQYCSESSSSCDQDEAL